MTGLPIPNVVQGFKDCGGVPPQFMHDFMQRMTALRLEDLKTTKFEEFGHPELKEVYFAEAQHFINRALYHLALGKRLITAATPTWGLVSLYYSSFFSAQAAIRLKGTVFFRLSYDESGGVAPTYRIEAMNLIADRYRVRRASERGEHHRVWNAFYDHFNGFGSRTGYFDVAPVTDPVVEEERFAEMFRRHLVNYVPGHAYYELAGAAGLRKVVTALSRDVRDQLLKNLEDPDGQMEARAYLRFRLCCGLLREIAEAKGAYERRHADVVEQRRALLEKWECPPKLAKHLIAAL